MNPPTNSPSAESGTPAVSLLSRFVAPKSTRLSRRDRVRQGLLIALAALLVIGLLWAANLFVSLRLSLRRIYFVPGDTSGKIALVALDDASLTAYGRSPTQWSRSIYADLLGKLGSDGARAVVFDLLFVEPDAADQQFADAIQQLRAQHTSVVLAAAGIGSVQTVTTADGFTALSYPTLLRPVKPLADAADYLAFTNSFADTDGLIRRQPSLFQTPEGDLGLSLSLTAYLAYLRIPAVAAPQVLTAANGVLDVTPQRQLTVDQDGLWLQNYFGVPGASFPIYSLQAVVNGQVDPAKFKDKIVLVGLMNNLGAVDTYPVPSSAHGEQMPGVEIQAHALETLLQNSALSEQPVPTQAILIIVLALISASAYAQVRWYFKLVLGAALLVLLLIAASFYFSLTHTIVDLFYTGLALTLPLLISIGLDITTEISRRQRTEFLLESMVAVANEQMAIDKMLPRIAADLRRSLDLDAGAIWLNEDNNGGAPVIHSFTPDSAAQLQPLYQTLSQTPRAVVESDRLAVPILWQKRLVGVIALKLKRGRVGRATQYLVEDIAEQIAPSLENARLFEQIQREVKLREAILHGAPTGIAIVNHQYEVVTANAVFDDIWDVESSDFLDLLSAAEVEDKAIKRLCDHLAQPGDFEMQLKIAHQTFNLSATLLPAYALWVMTFSDVTALADLNALKSHLIRMASHDLKNPLSVVMAYAELIEMSGDQVPKETLEYVGRIHRSGQTMLNIIEDILKLEQLRSTELPRELMAFTATVTEVIERHKPEMILKHQTFEAQIADDLPFINGNPGQLSQVVTNLLGNAVKYTPDNGHITVRLYQANPPTIRLEVQDTGYGIPKDQQAKLFTEFYRVRTQATADIPGTGLGLSLVKSVVEVHEGKIWVESEEDQGSTFFVELPIASQEQEHEA